MENRARFRAKDIKNKWWPSSAKLVKDKKWENGIHCHDYLQLIRFIVTIIYGDN